MTDKNSPQRPQKTAVSRDDRLKAALKANLSRRKAQSRKRDQASVTTEITSGRTEQEKDA